MFLSNAKFRKYDYNTGQAAAKKRKYYNKVQQNGI